MAYIKARLFDMLIGDWSRHEDQWRWAEMKEGEKIIYKPVPRDRDQAYTKFDGSMLPLFIGGFDHLQTFDHTIKDVEAYNFSSRNLDRLMANEPSREQWIMIAKELQQQLTDNVIENAVRQLPPEVFPISGNEIISKLKSRRDHLVEYATTYYAFLAHATDIPGTKDREYFEVNRVNDANTIVNIYKIKKDETKEVQPFYSRSFLTTETDEIRLYGMEGDDIFHVMGNSDKAILVRLVPGPGSDSITDLSSVDGRKEMTRVYDDEKMAFQTSGETRLRISDDSLLNNYQYKHFDYDKKGFVFRPGLTIGIGYHIEKEKWRKEPVGYDHRWMGYYGPNRGSVAFEYRLIMYQLIGKWDLASTARFDFPYVANYFGTGNETIINTDVSRKYYRFLSTGFTLGFNIHRLFDSAHLVSIGSSFKTMNLKNDPDRFIATESSGVPASAMEPQHFANAELAYQFKKTNDWLVPTRGFQFDLSGGYTKNISKPKGFAHYGSSVSFYLPFLKNLSLAMRAGGAAITGNPEFYQLTSLGGKENLRGYRRQRFHGKTSFYNNNEIRWVLHTRNRVFTGKLGFLGFVDQGRVWQPGEKSDQWHVGYGAGFFVAPFNKILLNATYGISSEDNVFHFRIGFFF